MDKEREKVCTVEELLGQTEKYFCNILLKEPITIYEISIEYSSYFTDKGDGPLKNIVCPFWVVKYWDGEDALQLVFDAYTGEYKECGARNIQ